MTLVVLVIKNPESLTITEKIILGVGLPVQVFWALLGWITVSSAQNIFKNLLDTIRNSYLLMVMKLKLKFDDDG